MLYDEVRSGELDNVLPDGYKELISIYKTENGDIAVALSNLDKGLETLIDYLFAISKANLIIADQFGLNRADYMNVLFAVEDHNMKAIKQIFEATKRKRNAKKK